MISVIIPAYNEEKYLPATLSSLRSALASIAGSELIVVDNESTDRTREIASEFGAKIVDESVHNIGKVRNSGGFAASGDVLVFIDADTCVANGLFQKMIETMSDERCLGGSVEVEFEPVQRTSVKMFMALWQFAGRFLKWRQGAAQFCRKDVFVELSGYDPTIYLGEDIEFHWRLDRLAKTRGGRTVFIRDPRVRTSSRRWDRMGFLRMVFISHPITILLAWRKPSMWKDWYENAIR